MMYSVSFCLCASFYYLVSKTACVGSLAHKMQCFTRKHNVFPITCYVLVPYIFILQPQSNCASKYNVCFRVENKPWQCFEKNATINYEAWIVVPKHVYRMKEWKEASCIYRNICDYRCLKWILEAYMEEVWLNEVCKYYGNTFCIKLKQTKSKQNFGSETCFMS